MPAVDPQALAALLRSGSQAQDAMRGQGAISERERAMAMGAMQPMQQSPVLGINGLAGQGAVSEAERARAMQAMGQMGGMGQGMGQMSEADRKFLMMQQGQ